MPVNTFRIPNKKAVRTSPRCGTKRRGKSREAKRAPI
jgi:hypothetical protein